MKKAVKLTVALLGFAMIFGTSCKKYEEGPGMSLRSKKARLANTWVVEKYVDKDGDERVTTQAERDASYVEYKKDGTFTVTTTFGGNSSTTNGTWEFTDSKKKLKSTIDFGVGTTTSEVTIIKLKNKEMATEDEDGDKTYLIQK